MRMRASTVIHRSREALFACVTTVTFLEQWVAPFHVGTYSASNEHGYLERRHTMQIPPVRQISPGTIGKGTTFRQMDGSNSHPQEATIEVTEYEWPVVFSLTVTSEHVISQTKLIFATAPDGTTLTLIQDSQFSSWPLRMLAFMIALQAKKRKASYMRRLQEYLEGQC